MIPALKCGLCGHEIPCTDDGKVYPCTCQDRAGVEMVRNLAGVAGMLLDTQRVLNGWKEVKG
jgi:hypothetical protein